ncbi:MAG: menaquinone biosynthesis decarboxylase [Alistipes sp.]|nr:menaquinone biosynthesis decarboxylase [Candidatus Alistipes equi]
MYRNLNSFIDRLEREGELLRIKCHVDTDCEIAEIADRVFKNGGKALLFENTGKKFPVLILMYGSEKRLALALGASSLSEIESNIKKVSQLANLPHMSFTEKVRLLPELFRLSRILPKKIRSKAECQEVIKIGEEVNLDEIPMLKCWPKDAERFITLPMVHTIDPDTKARNVGMYRMQYINRNSTFMHWHVHKTGERHYQRYRELGKRMPVAVTLGGDPAYAYSATAPLPDGVDEYLLSGYLRKKRVKLVKCITQDIYVPSNCDFVLEGYVDPQEEKGVEGPFGDHTGFYTLEEQYPIFHITCITHRKRAIYPATIVGIPPMEDSLLAKATERIFLEPIRLMMQQEICDLCMPKMGVQHNLVCISARQNYSSQAKKIALGLWGAGQMMFNKYMIILDQKTSLNDTDKISSLWRGCNFKNSIFITEGVYDVLDHRAQYQGKGGKMMIDLTKSTPKEITLSQKEDAEMRALPKWSCVFSFSEESEKYNGYIGTAKAIVIFDFEANVLNDDELLWLALANTDPLLDIKLESGTLLIDARIKKELDRWPNVVTSSMDTIELVDKKWNKYQIGEFLPSPSRKYIALLHGTEAAVKR